MEKEKVLEILEGIKKNDEYSLTYTFNGVDLVVKVTPFITYSRRLSLINDIANFVFEDTDEGTKYTPEFYELAVRMHTIAYFTDLEIFAYPMDKVCDILFHTTLFNDVYRLIADYTGDIWLAVNELISTKKELLKSAANSMTGQLGKILQKLTQGMGDMTPEDMMKIIEKFQSLNLPTDITQDGLVKAILKQNNAENKK